MKKCWKNLSQFGTKSLTSQRKTLIKILLQKEFNKNLVDKGKFINTRIKCFKGKVIKEFLDKKQRQKAPKMGSCRICLPEMVLECVLRMKNNDANYKYFQQIYMEQCKFEEMETREREIKSSKKKMVAPKIMIKGIRMSLSKKIVNKMLDKQVFLVSATTNTIKFIFCTTKHKRDITRLSQKMITTLFQGTQSLKDV